MRQVRFVDAARREFLAEVIYYNNERVGLGARFTAAVEEATARAAAFPLTGSPASMSTRRVFVRLSVCSRLSTNAERDYRIRSRALLSPSRLLAFACSRSLTGYEGHFADIGCDVNCQATSGTDPLSTCKSDPLVS